MKIAKTRRLIAITLGLAGAAMVLPKAAGAADRTAYATFAGGCFWCIEADFEKLEGVLSVTSGYTGGRVANPTYKQVSKGGTGHAEAVRVVYDPEVVTYPIPGNDDAVRAKGVWVRSRKTKPFAAPIVTEITEGTAFYPAEASHQDYAEKNPIRYRYYRNGCGRDQRLRELWGEEK